MIVVLQDEQTLQAVLTMPDSPVTVPAQPRPLPYTSALKAWFSSLVEAKSNALLPVLTPVMVAGAPPLVKVKLFVQAWSA
jgi:hypothetical protein